MRHVQFNMLNQCYHHIEWTLKILAEQIPQMCRSEGNFYHIEDRFSQRTTFIYFHINKIHILARNLTYLPFDYFRERIFIQTYFKKKNNGSCPKKNNKLWYLS